MADDLDARDLLAVLLEIDALDEEEAAPHPLEGNPSSCASGDFPRAYQPVKALDVGARVPAGKPERGWCRLPLWLLLSRVFVAITTAAFVRSQDERNFRLVRRESIRDFAKGAGSPVAIQDNVVDLCKRSHREVARP